MVAYGWRLGRLRVGNIQNDMSELFWRVLKFKSLSRSPTAGQTASNHSPRYFRKSRPLGKRSFYTVTFQEEVKSSIIALLKIRCPAAILFVVIAVYVFSIQARTGKISAAHVFEKSDELFPLGAVGNSAPAIVFITSCFRVITTCFHRFPAKVNVLNEWIGIVLRPTSVNYCSLPNFFFEATASLLSISKACPCDNTNPAALEAFASPISHGKPARLSVKMGKAKDTKISELFPDDVFYASWQSVFSRSVVHLLTLNPRSSHCQKH